jgi:hypothetical protein
VHWIRNCHCGDHRYYSCLGHDTMYFGRCLLVSEKLPASIFSVDLPLGWWRQVPLTQQCTSTKLHGIIWQRTVISM